MTNRLFIGFFIRTFMVIDIVIIALISMNVFAYLLPRFVVFGGSLSNSVNHFLSLGAKDNQAIIDGEYYRLLTSTFLHANLLHLFVNMYSLAIVGQPVIKIFSRSGFISIFLVSGVCGSFTSFLFNESLSVGASGAVFGLVGALFAYSMVEKNYRLIKNLSYIILINFVFGVLNYNIIDNWGHLGGLVGGLITGYILPREKVVY